MSSRLVCDKFVQSLVDDRWRPVTTGAFGLVIGGDGNEKDMKKM